MYPFAWCYQTITPDIIETLEVLYTVPVNENYDLYVENASAVGWGNYLNGSVSIGNLGASTTPETTISIIVNDVVIYEFDIAPIEGAWSYNYFFS